MPIDLDAAQDVFATSTDATVGLEEEFAILDPVSLELVGRFEEMHRAAAADPVLAQAVSGELISAEIEIRSGRGENLAEALAAQRDARSRLFALAGARGLELGATGTHPFSDYRRQQIIETEHYRRLRQELAWVARRNNTFSLHVHVGVRDANRAVRVCDRLRPVLPELLAVSANSPGLDGCDTGLHSARTQSFTKTFPRCGVPDAYGGWEAYADYLRFLMATGSVVEYTQVWWSVRPHLGFGTVEVRICDAQATAAESDALATLIVACVLQAARDEDEGRPAPDVPGRLIEENMWRAIRHGLDGRLIDLARVQEYPAVDALHRLALWTAPVRFEHGLGEGWPQSLNGAQRQRRALDAGVGLREVYAATVRETHESYRAAGPAPRTGAEGPAPVPPDPTGGDSPSGAGAR